MESVVGSQKKQAQKGQLYARNGEMRERGVLCSLVKSFLNSKGNGENWGKLG